MSARAIQVCGTGSGVGKSVIVAGLCRIFLQDGLKVAPFKAQNMSLNSFVTSEGGEIGRAQAMQAAACHIAASVDMNPVLLKPTSDTGSQVILRGRPVGNMSAQEYKSYKLKARSAVLRSFNNLKKKFDAIVIEGAGSPAEVNLKSQDIVNMKMAQAAGASVLLVADIDKGGVFAWIVGTLELLTKAERKRVKAIIINKFRGDKKLLAPGIEFLEKKTGIKVLGVVPYFSSQWDIRLPEEDSVALEGNTRDYGNTKPEGLIDIAVIKLPRISNFTDFAPLENEQDVRLRYVVDSNELLNADVIIIPGTKNTIDDLTWLRERGLAGKISSVMKQQPLTALIGICGGFQMLGENIRDEYCLESKQREIPGLGLLPITTNFKKEKILAQVRAREAGTNLEVGGYEIHHGRTELRQDNSAAFKIFMRQGKKADDCDGFVTSDAKIWGTYIHGVFDEPDFRRGFLNRLRLKKGWAPLKNNAPRSLDGELDKLAGVLRDNLDIDLIYKILSKKVR